MNKQPTSIKKILDCIANNELENAITFLSKLLNNSPYLDELILQSSRYNDLKKQIRLDIIDFEQSNLTKNKIRLALLELVGEIELYSSDSKVVKEIIAFEQTHPEMIIIQDSGASTVFGNVHISGEIVSGRDMQIGSEKILKKKPFWKFW